MIDLNQFYFFDKAKFQEQAFYAYRLACAKDLNRFDWQTRRTIKETYGEKHQEIYCNGVRFVVCMEGKDEGKLYERKNSQASA